MLQFKKEIGENVKKIFEQRPSGDLRQPCKYEAHCLKHQHCKCKGPEAGEGLACSKRRKEAQRLRVKKAKKRIVEGEFRDNGDIFICHPNLEGIKAF